MPLLPSSGRLCPVKAVKALLQEVATSESGPLFVFIKGGSVVPLIYSDVRFVIRSWALSLGINPSTFGSHSARIGAATSAFKAGVDDLGIMKLGDWLSNTFLTYVKQDWEDLRKIQFKMLLQLEAQTH